jgi:spore germination protein GerM
MNFLQRLSLFILIMITILYVYFSFFYKNNNFLESISEKNNTSSYNPVEISKEKEVATPVTKLKEQDIKIFLIDNSGNLKSVKRTCNLEKEESCFKFAINELISAPTRFEKSKGLSSEIPHGTKILSIRESRNSTMIDLSSNFESGGGAESTYMRLKQIIKTVNSNTSTPTYLYINGRQANVIGGEGIMIKQPLSERSFDE